MKLIKLPLFLFSLIVGISQPAHAVFTVVLSEVGSDVVATGTGSLDISGLTAAGSFTENPRGLYPTNQTVRVGSTGTATINFYTGFTSTPGAFGAGGFTAASSGTGDLVAVNNSFVRIFDGFVSGSSLTTSNTFSGTALDSLGVTAGTYTWAWSSDSFVLEVQPSACLLYTSPSPRDRG